MLDLATQYVIGPRVAYQPTPHPIRLRVFPNLTNEAPQRAEEKGLVSRKAD